jgi:hypothetical protein
MRNQLNLPWDACVHSARNTALTNLGLPGVDMFTVQRAAGHADVDPEVRPSNTDDDEGRIPEEGSE